MDFVSVRPYDYPSAVAVCDDRTDYTAASEPVDCGCIGPCVDVEQRYVVGVLR